jgi:NADH-quinone oxidoreductase subunit J
MVLGVAFWILAVVGVISAISVVSIKDVFRAALALIACFLSAAGIYVTLQADFIAVVQVLIYVGAIALLILLGIMLTRNLQQGSLNNKLVIPAFLVAGLFLALLVYTIVSTPWPISPAPVPQTTTGVLAGKLFLNDGFILPLEIAGMLILSAIIGAITVVREK